MRILFLLLTLALLSSFGCKPPQPPKNVADNQPDIVETERVKAEAGVGKQGQSMKGKEGIIRTPLKAYFSEKQRLVFLNVKRALSLYEAEHGFMPKTEEEFMSKIIENNNIKLPELPEGQKYVWDPEAAELMVEKPK